MRKALAPFLLIALAALPSRGAAGPRDAVLVPGGKFRPLYGFGKNSSEKEYKVERFWMDKAPVSRREYFRFLDGHPQWRKQGIQPVLADGNYLRGIPKNRQSAPITQIPWYAAAAYCESQGGRLPSVLEWEFAAAADQRRPDASRDPVFVEKILDWYAKRDGLRDLKPAGSGNPNFYGIFDLHGLIWEWTSDFNSVFVTGDNRQDGDKDLAGVCGAGATDATNRSDYAAFMRYAMRSSVQANFSLPTLGFRCAYDRKGE